MSRARGAIVALCCGLCFCAAPSRAADVKPVASVTLPCDSSNQVISQDGKFVAATCPDGSLHVLEISSGRELFAQPAGVRITSRDFSRDGKSFALGFWDGTAKIVPLAGGAPVAWKAGEHRIHSIHFLAGGETIYTDGLGEPGQIWNFSGTPKLVATLHSDFSGPVVAAVSPDGRLFATADGDTAIRIYDTSTWKMLHENRSATKLEMFDIDFTPDGKAFLTGGADDHVLVIDAATGNVTGKLGGQPGVIADISIPGEGTHAIVEYVDVDDQNKPPVYAMWNLQTQKAEPMPDMARYSAHRIVNGRLWLAKQDGNKLQILEYN
jgi:WD40 repeat protein